MPERVDIKSHKIMTMDENKRKRIINAAMIEFCKGFKNTSTDIIVREAGISKGLLFHYFGTKEKLYNFLVWYSYDTMMAEYFNLINTNQSDILERIWQMTLLKIDLSYKYPAIFEFLAAAYSHSKDNHDDAFFVLFKTMQTEVMSNVFRNVDASLFKDGIDTNKVTNIIMWTLTGYADSIVTKNKKVEDYQKEYDLYLSDMKEYFDIFRNSFYK